jgi:hypothetical protein
LFFSRNFSSSPKGWFSDFPHVQVREQPCSKIILLCQLTSMQIPGASSCQDMSRCLSRIQRHRTDILRHPRDPHSLHKKSVG